MKKLILIALLMLALPAHAQSQLKAKVSTFTDINNAGVDYLSRRDYPAAETRFREAYRLAALEGSSTRMRTSLSNLSTLYQLTGRAAEQGRIQAIMQSLDAPPIIQAAPCNSCVDSRIMNYYMQQLEMQNNQQAFDRQTFREDHTFQLQAQREDLEAQKRAYESYLTRQREREYLRDLNDRARRAEGTSYWAKNY